MNSKVLKKQFKHIYNAFFLRNQFVVSAPFLHSWTMGGEYLEVSCIKQHIPLRLYVGLERGSDQGCSLGTITYYNPSDSQFFEYSIDKVLSYRHILKEYLNSINTNIGYTLNILSEIPEDVGLDFEYITSLLVGKVISKLGNDNNVFMYAQKIAYQINGYDSDFPIHASAYQSPCPIYHNKEGIGEIPQQIFEQIDVSVIYSGVPVKNHFVLTNNLVISTHFPEPNEVLKNLESNLIDHVNNILEPINVYAYYSLSAFEKKLTEESINEIIRILGRSRLLLHTFRRRSRHYIITINEFINSFLKDKDPQAGQIAIIPHTKTLIGGSYTIVVPFNRARSILLDTVSSSLKAISPSSFLIYSSRQDGEEPEGLKVEQDLENGVFSEFVSKDLHVLKMTDGSILTGSFHELLDNDSVDVILDSDDKKVYVAGKKLTAKDITSQSTLVEIYEHFFTHSPSKTIRNTDLPRSAFSREKNNMNGKLIIPFKKIIKTSLGKTLHIKVTGTLTHFDLIFGDSDVRIGLLTQVGGK